VRNYFFSVRRRHYRKKYLRHVTPRNPNVNYSSYRFSPMKYITLNYRRSIQFDVFSEEMKVPNIRTNKKLINLNY